MLLKTKPFKISYVAGVVSNQIVDVEEYCKGFGTEKKIKRLIRDTGFKKLSIAPEGVCASDMCIQAAKHIMNHFNVRCKDIGALIFVSQTPDYVGPATAFVMQKKLELPSSMVAFDTNLGCSGFVIGLYMAASLVPSMPNKKIMLCCGDVVSHQMSPDSQGRRAITGDAGSCMIVEKNDNSDKDIWFNIDSYGERYKSLYAPNGAARNEQVIVDEKMSESDIKNYSVMDGMDIFNFSINEVPQNINELMNHLQISKDNIGEYLFHQPNYILIKALQDVLNISKEKVVYNSQNIGNTSSVSIPLLLTEIGKKWQDIDNKLVLMSGFGIGLSVASTVLDLTDTVCIDTLKYKTNE